MEYWLGLVISFGNGSKAVEDIYLVPVADFKAGESVSQPLSTQAFAMTAKTLPAVEKLDSAYIEDALKTVSNTQQEVVVREFDPKFMRKTMLKVCRLRYSSEGCALTLADGLDPDASVDSE
jgi:hypothetical protein